ncbi:MAG: ROK family protein, partial [Armatimonadetes bacterium]|nr:ROK family protein [Armatimonadota bacterium]
MNHAKKVAIGIDLGGTNFSVGACGPAGEPTLPEFPSFDTPSETSAEQLVDELARRAREVLERADGEAIGVGVGIPGVVEADRGWVVKCPNLPALNETPAALMLSERLELTVFLNNDAYCATLAELRWGAGRGCSNLLMLTLGTGIGGGVAMGGKVIRGPRGILGEIGHMIVQPEGPLCGCGNHGCLEALAGRDGIINRALAKVRGGRRSSLLDRLGEDWGPVGEEIPRIIAEEAKSGDAVAIETLEETGFWVGIGICNALILCDPDKVVIGGGIAAAGEVLFGAIRSTVADRSRITRGKFDVANIVPAALGNAAGVLGAAALVW